MIMLYVIITAKYDLFDASNYVSDIRFSCEFNLQ